MKFKKLKFAYMFSVNYTGYVSNLVQFENQLVIHKEWFEQLTIEFYWHLISDKTILK